MTRHHTLVLILLLLTADATGASADDRLEWIMVLMPSQDFDAPHALLYAGSPGVISTLWDIRGDAAAVRMNHFYSRLLDSASRR